MKQFYCVIFILIQFSYCLADTFKTVTPGYLTIAASPAFPPVAYLDSAGQWQGSDIIFLKEFAHSKGLQLKIVKSDFEGTWRLPAQGKVDMGASGITILPNRQLDGITYSQPYFEVQRAYVVREAETAKLSKTSDFNGKKVGYVIGSIVEADLKKFSPHAQLIPYEIAEDGIQAVLDGKIDGFGHGDISANMFAKERKGLAVTALHKFDPKSPELFGYPINQKSAGLREAINGYIGPDGAKSIRYQKAMTQEPRSYYAGGKIQKTLNASLVPEELKTVSSQAKEPTLTSKVAKVSSADGAPLEAALNKNGKFFTKHGRLLRRLGMTGGATIGGYMLWTGYKKYDQTSKVSSVKEKNLKYMTDLDLFFSLSLDQQSEIRLNDLAFDQAIFEKTKIPLISKPLNCSEKEVSFTTENSKTDPSSALHVTFQRKDGKSPFASSSVSFENPESKELMTWFYDIKDDKVKSNRFRAKKGAADLLVELNEIDQLRNNPGGNSMDPFSHHLFEVGYYHTASSLKDKVQQCCESPKCQENMSQLEGRFLKSSEKKPPTSLKEGIN